jgi:hypothetical protein
MANRREQVHGTAPAPSSSNRPSSRQNATERASIELLRILGEERHTCLLITRNVELEKLE